VARDKKIPKDSGELERVKLLCQLLFLLVGLEIIKILVIYLNM
jgi:hypothetical protein